MSEELDKKYGKLVKDPFVFEAILAVNHKPHPYVIGPKHVAHASDHYCGRLGEATLEAIPCAFPRCNLSYDEHTFDRVCFVKLTRNASEDEAREALKALVDEFEKDKIDGVTFIETPEQYRIGEGA